MAFKKIIIATNNPGKFNEIKEALKEVPADFITPEQAGVNLDVEETGEDYAENALIKARDCYEKSGYWVIAEDSGLVVKAMPDALGLKTRRFGKGESASDQEWVDHFLEIMTDKDDRSAKFICYAAVIIDGEEYIFPGEIEGIITHQLEADILPGLPLSSCFRPMGSDRVYAALTREEKNDISHRGRAFSQVRDFLNDKIDA